MLSLYKLLTITILWLSMAACHSSTQTDENASLQGAPRKLSKIKETALPEVVSLKSLKKTMFTPTLESLVDEEKNAIYVPTLLFAWNKIEELLKSEIVISESNSQDLQLITQSKSHEQSLNPDEYKIEVDTKVDAIVARAFFHKSLPFKIEFHALQEPIVFGKTKVAAFGLDWQDFDVIEATQILYYKDDAHLVLKLLPRHNQHEIILALGLDKFKSLKDALGLLNENIEKGKKEKTEPKQAWKYALNEEDRFAIPIIKFHIDTKYKTLEGQQFFTKDGRPHIVHEAYQRTGFVLDQNGAVLESEDYTSVDSLGAELPHPKKMIYNKPFLIVLKRVDKTNPYFVMSVNNTELMVRK